ncbi:MAG: hypothetical protein HYS38_10055 [Acidobacteria bacterium]|nr:hypothetical protein [Acidobacteriota bacterium]
MATSKIRVKLMSEAAEYISVTPVVQRDYSLAELVDLMLPILGKDTHRIIQLLRVGTFSTGEYRYRWAPPEIGEEEVKRILETLPGPDPSRKFEPESCFLVRFRRGPEMLDLSRERAARKNLFARRSFWEALLPLAEKGVQYADYSYADKADVFTLALDQEGLQSLHDLLPLLKPASAAERLERLRPERIEWLSRR